MFDQNQPVTLSFMAGRPTIAGVVDGVLVEIPADDADPRDLVGYRVYVWDQIALRQAITRGYDISTWNCVQAAVQEQLAAKLHLHFATEWETCRRVLASVGTDPAATAARRVWQMASDPRLVFHEGHQAFERTLARMSNVWHVDRARLLYLRGSAGVDADRERRAVEMVLAPLVKGHRLPQKSHHAQTYRMVEIATSIPTPLGGWTEKTISSYAESHAERGLFAAWLAWRRADLRLTLCDWIESKWGEHDLLMVPVNSVGEGGEIGVPDAISRNEADVRSLLDAPDVTWVPRDRFFTVTDGSVRGWVMANESRLGLTAVIPLPTGVLCRMTS